MKVKVSSDAIGQKAIRDGRIVRIGGTVIEPRAPERCTDIAAFATFQNGECVESDYQWRRNFGSCGALFGGQAHVDYYEIELPLFDAAILIARKKLRRITWRVGVAGWWVGKQLSWRARDRFYSACARIGIEIGRGLNPL